MQREQNSSVVSSFISAGQVCKLMSLIILFVEVDGNCELVASPKLFWSALIVFNDLSLSKIIIILITERNS